MENPELTVIIPVYNSGHAAVKLVQSLERDQYNKSQTLEILIVDDGSTDDSLKYLRSLVVKKQNQPKSPKIRLLAEKNQGPSAARNLGLKNAKGKYIIFLDSDDSVDKTFLTKMTAALKNNPAALAVCGFTYKFKNGKTKTAFTNPTKISSPLKNLLFDGRLYSSVNKIFRHDLIKKHHLQFNENLNFGEDTMFVLNYLKAASGTDSSAKILVLPEPLYHYHISDHSLVSASNKNWQKWQQLHEEVKAWDDNQHKTLLKLLKLRWRISWVRRQGT